MSQYLIIGFWECLHLQHSAMFMWKNIHSPNLGFLLVIVNGLVLRENLNLNHGFSPSNMFFFCIFSLHPSVVHSRYASKDRYAEYPTWSASMRCSKLSRLCPKIERTMENPWQTLGFFKVVLPEKNIWISWIFLGHLRGGFITGPALVLWGLNPQWFCWNPPKTD